MLVLKLSGIQNCFNISNFYEISCNQKYSQFFEQIPKTTLFNVYIDY